MRRKQVRLTERSIPTTRRRARLCFEPLEDRCTPAAVTYVEDFSSDTNHSNPGFDQYDDSLNTTEPDRFLIFNTLSSGGAGPTDGPHSPNGYFAIEDDAAAASRHYLTFLTTSTTSAADFDFRLDNTGQPGGIPPGQSCAGVSWVAEGSGHVIVRGRTTFLSFDFVASEWQQFTFTSLSENASGIPIGPLVSVHFSTRDSISVDDLAVTLDELLPPAVGEGNVQVNTLGPDMGIIGDGKANAILVEMLDPTAGQVRVTGLGGTRVNGQLQVTVTGVFRDTFVTMNGGGDFVQLIGDPADDDRPFTLEDDLLFDMGNGDNTVWLDNLQVGDLLAHRSRSGRDVIQMLDTWMGRLDLHTGAGRDTVRTDLRSVLRRDGLGPAEVNRINTGDDKDVLDIGLGVFEALTVDSGDGGDELTFRSFCEVEAPVGIDLGEGRDTLQLAAAHFKDEVQVQMGPGADILRFDAVIFTLRANFQPGSGGATLDLFGSLHYGGFIVPIDADLFTRLETLAAPIFLSRFALADV